MESNNRSRIWILGAADPEMALIKDILRQQGERFVQALDEHQRPVYAANAYDAKYPEIVQAQEIFFVECAILSLRVPDGARIVQIDHHRPGDPGYGGAPATYLESSSLGQTLLHLEARGKPVEITKTIRFAAAADHCLHHAYRGRCPGIDPDALMRWRLASRAAYQRRPVEALMADLERARQCLRKRRDAGEEIPFFKETLPELPEASAREGIPFCAELIERGRKKQVIQGASAEVLRQWMQEKEQQGFSVYGDPERGFAGCYLD